MRSPAACTIISRNYLSHARILARSWRQHEPGGRFYALVVDGLPDGECVGREVRVLAPEELGLPSFPEMCRKYDVTELSTAVKPSLLALLLDSYREEAVVYLDPDILILRPLDELWQALAGASLVLTPHLLSPIPRDGRTPGERDILLAGAYNLGFLALCDVEETHRFLAWWGERLQDGCRIDPARGLFVDQRWVDLVPGLFPSTVLLRDETYNVAYWNLHSRPLERRGDRFSIHGRPLAFFHFSGFDPATPRVLSRHQNRTTVADGTALADLLDGYAELHLQNGYAVSRRWGYGHARPGDGPAASASPPLGVNLAGYIAAETGVGEAVRSAVRSLQAAGIAYVLNNVTDDVSANRDTSFTGFAADNPHPINLVHVNADQVPLFVRQKGDDYFRHRYSIGYWFWELSRFPEEWQSSFGCFQEIWVGSQFTLDALSRVAPIPVVRIPLSVQEELPRLDGDRSRFGLPPLPSDRFVFLFVFDFYSVMERKNPLGLIRAFRRAFRKGDDAVLVLKCWHGESFPSELAALKRAAAGTGVRILDGVLSRVEINTLLSLSDCYVSLHRAEGFGLTLAEAMSLEKPVIATGYSGNMDFMTQGNSFPVGYELVELDEDHGPYRRGCVWAEPDLDHAASLMRLVYEDRERAREVGRKARQDVRRSLAPEVVGEGIQERLARIAAFAASAGLSAGLERDRSRHRLLVRVRQVVRDTVAAGATVVVVSKGDDELLRLGDRHGWHFPRTDDGRYAGHHPADSRAAIGHLEALRALGGEYLLFPGSAFWWLDYYDGFARHLDACYPRIWKDESCILYRLQRTAA